MIYSNCADGSTQMVGILGLYNTLTSSVLERQREIGIWRSMGASNWQVARSFWIEDLSLASLSWLVGAIVGIPIAYGFDCWSRAGSFLCLLPLMPERCR